MDLVNSSSSLCVEISCAVKERDNVLPIALFLEGVVVTGQLLTEVTEVRDAVSSLFRLVRWLTLSKLAVAFKGLLGI